jgi:hypothetical protein
MKKTISKYSIFILILALHAVKGTSQDIPGAYPSESVIATTDRTMYISGENILFSGLTITENANSTNDLSRILYCELITPDGTRISGGKYAVWNSSVHGSLAIPEDAITGYYYLKSYTRLMRNSGPNSYHFARVKVINPGKPEVLPVVELPENSVVSSCKTGQPGYRVTADKSYYHPGEEVFITVNRIPEQDQERKLAMSVVPAASWDSIGPVMVQYDSIPEDFQFYGETRGISISGRLAEEKTGDPVSNALVNLSIIGDKDVMAIRTNSAGRFYFALPGYSGNRDIFLCSEERNGVSVSIFIDNDFCTKPISLPSPVFHLSDEEKNTALSMAANHKVSSIFNTGTAGAMQPDTFAETSFYGKPDETLVMEKYIDLPSVEEYFSELLGSVNVRKFEGRKIFRFNSIRTEMTIFDPLVLIDMVAVNDIEKVLAMSPRLIDRIELVNAPYVKGNITYGGIISFFSKNNDFAGVDLPSSGTFINYQFLSASQESMPAGPNPENIPDARNTVYWNPDIKTEGDGSARISIRMPATPGKYLILLTGIGYSGDCFTLRKEIEVMTF